MFFINERSRWSMCWNRLGLCLVTPFGTLATKHYRRMYAEIAAEERSGQ